EYVLQVTCSCFFLIEADVRQVTLAYIDRCIVQLRVKVLSHVIDTYQRDHDRRHSHRCRADHGDQQCEAFLNSGVLQHITTSYLITSAAICNNLASIVRPFVSAVLLLIRRLILSLENKPTLLPTLAISMTPP